MHVVNYDIVINFFNLVMTEEVTYQPIPCPVASLANHVERMHLNENCGFSEEYKVLMLETGA